MTWVIVFSGVTIFEVAEARSGDKRKREKRGDPGSIEGYKGKVMQEKQTYPSVSVTTGIKPITASPQTSGHSWELIGLY